MNIEQTHPRIGNPLTYDYIFNFNKVSHFLGYNPYDKQSWHTRCEWLGENNLSPREELVHGLMEYNQGIGNHPVALQNIERLKDQSAYVVIGGQQAGILTGPLYVIHKAISIIKLAEEMEKETGRHLVPVFWIASEDHDFDEVNHLYTLTANQGIKKVKLHKPTSEKQSVNEITFEQGVFSQYIEEFFSYLPDSPHQAVLKKNLLEIAASCQTLNEFFARIMVQLFGHYGLVLVDSAEPFVREIEKPIFKQLISTHLEDRLLKTEQELKQLGYNPQLDHLQGNAHFFLHLDQERQLIERDGESFQTKNGKQRFSKEQLLELLETNPTLFSANVVSRPIMQEYLFPVAGFVGGPGEIAYWAQLKPVFDHFHMQMPIVFPRLTFTIIERNVAKYMEQYQLTFQDVCGHWEERRKEWLAQQEGKDWEEAFRNLNEQMAEIYIPFVQSLAQAEPGLKSLGENNWGRIAAHIQFLQKRTTYTIEQRNAAELKRWEMIRDSLQPLEKPQERVYNIFGYLNKYGTSLINQMMNQSISLDERHKLIYI